MGLQPSSHTPKLNRIEADQSQPKNQSPVSGPICNHRASGQANYQGHNHVHHPHMSTKIKYARHQNIPTFHRVLNQKHP